MLLQSARAAKINDAFFINSKFIRNNLSFMSQVYGRLSAGAEASYVKHDNFDDGNFFVSAPLIMSYDTAQIALRPFVMPQTNDLSAYGATFNLLLNMEQNNIDDKFTQANISVGYVNQKADVARAGGGGREDFGELVYGLGLRKNFFNSFVFGANANIYEYLDGIAGVRGIRSIFNQNDFSNLNSYDVVYNLPKYSLGATFNRMLDKGANIYLSYSYTEFYTADHEHSMIIGNDFPVSRAVKADLGYNHIITGNSGKKDIFKIALSVVF
ncbi:MAG: hypothetical protein LBI01_02275 [Elusimicrobium sp.]|jgi:hypothetical protein|nr:hypothetical protein [Elusimicrobium sp.]